ncbi:hypothetical protein [Allocoleopsis franciscana]|uniref:Uncharacterized protein n=1 Tax=Allocoleopsis franciscana PCC 7113 TaxID=1173027 RepID=K9WDL3_9CYAN|nr:hypothetical protein [Allocoleopsis franciscana]AFZ17587.1 hypothetical protein Mic7113_1724 [Allocoleopsis franciscana PCC 7113]
MAVPLFLHNWDALVFSEKGDRKRRFQYVIDDDNHNDSALTSMKASKAKEIQR